MSKIVPVERMDVPQMIARAQYWTGWCLDNEINDGELTRLRYLLQAVTAHLQDERDATLAPSDPVHPPMPVGHIRACGCPECIAWLEAHEPRERGTR